MASEAAADAKEKVTAAAEVVAEKVGEAKDATVAAAENAATVVKGKIFLRIQSFIKICFSIE